MAQKTTFVVLGHLKCKYFYTKIGISTRAVINFDLLARNNDHLVHEAYSTLINFVLRGVVEGVSCPLDPIWMYRYSINYFFWGHHGSQKYH